MPASKINRFPETRITTIDVCEMGKKSIMFLGFLKSMLPVVGKKYVNLTEIIRTKLVLQDG